MKCEICGAEIPEGSLYCEKCGKDVHLVPDFTEFAVNKAEETVKNLISEFDDDETDFGRSPEGANDERPVRKKENSDEPKNKYGWIRFALLAASVVALAMVSLGFINRYSTAEYLLESAREHAESGDRAKAKAIIEALEVQDSDDVDVLLYLAELYKEDEEYIKYLQSIQIDELDGMKIFFFRSSDFLLQRPIRMLRRMKSFSPFIIRMKIMYRWRTSSIPATMLRSRISL